MRKHVQDSTTRRRSQTVMGAVISGLVVLAACKTAPDDPLQRYQAEITATGSAEQAVTDAWAPIQAFLNLGPKAEIPPPISQVKQVLLPAQEKYVKMLENIRPQDETLRRIHGLLLAAERHRLNGLYELSGAVRDGDGVAAFRSKTSSAELANAEAVRRKEAYTNALAEYVAKSASK